MSVIDLLSTGAEYDGDKLIEVLSPTISYVGWAPAGSATSAAVWKIARVTLASGRYSLEYASAVSRTLIWDNRSTYFSSVPWYNAYSLQFDGINDYVNLGNNLNKERTDSFSWSMWARFDNVTTAMTLISKRSGSGGTPGYHFNMLSNGRLEANLVNTASTNHLRLQMPNSILPLTWYHIVWTFLGASSPGAANLILYLNGTAIALSTITNNLSASIATSTDLFFGQFSTGQYFSGYLDEVSLWDRVLTPAEVLSLYNGGTPTDLSVSSPASNLQGWWRMGDLDTYPIIVDQGGAIDGTMTNMDSGDIVMVVP